MVTAKPTKSPIPRPGENVEPKPLSGPEALLLQEVFDYADEIHDADAAQDSFAMQRAKTIEALYVSETWVAEWLEIKPPKPNAVGRPVEPSSRNRFNEWLAWRASKSGRRTLQARRTYQLLNARKVQTYLHFSAKKDLPETAIRPIVWMLSRGYEDRIKDVERIALELADGKPVTAKITRKAMAEWKKQNLGTSGVTKANSEAKARNYRPQARQAFDRLMSDDPEQAREFVIECIEALKRATKGEAA